MHIQPRRIETVVARGQEGFGIALILGVALLGAGAIAVATVWWIGQHISPDLARVGQWVVAGVGFLAIVAALVVLEAAAVKAITEHPETPAPADDAVWNARIGKHWDAGMLAAVFVIALSVLALRAFDDTSTWPESYTVGHP